MRIYSKFRDYYDIGLAYGIDDLVYVRKTKELSYYKQSFGLGKTNDIVEAVHVPDIDKVVNQNRWYGDRFIVRHNSFGNQTPYISIILFFVGFCGKLYPGYKFGWQTPDENHYDYIYSIESLDKFLTKHPKIKKSLTGDSCNRRWYGWKSTYENLLKMFNEFQHGNLNDIFLN